MYNQNPYFGLGPKPKVKMADTIGPIPKQQLKWRNLATSIVWGKFFIIKESLKPNLLPNIKDF